MMAVDGGLVFMGGPAVVLVGMVGLVGWRALMEWDGTAALHRCDVERAGRQAQGWSNRRPS